MRQGKGCTLFLYPGAIGARAASADGGDNSTAPCFQTCPSFQVSKADPTTNTALTHPTPQVIPQEFTRRLVTLCKAPLLLPLSPAAKSGGQLLSKPSDSAAKAPRRRAQLPESARRSEIRREITPTLGTS